MIEIVLASNNKNKLSEISDILNKHKTRVLSLEDIGYLKEIKETGETLSENALIKARAIRVKAKGKIVIADDTGLEVDYLAKAPGVYSARFAGPKCSFKDNNSKLLKLLKGVKSKDRTATFRTVVAVIYANGVEEVYEGKVYGKISIKEQGLFGFGYDPVFCPGNSKKTYAQMTSIQKNSISHRKKAVTNALKGIQKRLML
ncbi:MAG: RdgB/HAM1 family non-canonical purine NTP pyrophosphatase [bacterium]